MMGVAGDCVSRAWMWGFSFQLPQFPVGSGYDSFKQLPGFGCGVFLPVSLSVCHAPALYGACHARVMTPTAVVLSLLLLLLLLMMIMMMMTTMHLGAPVADGRW